jgi:hypothetical protein
MHFIAGIRPLTEMLDLIVPSLSAFRRRPVLNVQLKIMW